MLLAFRATLPDLKGTLPDRVLVARWGRNDNVKGAPIVVNETTARLLPAVNRALGADTVALDFEHNTEPGTPEYEKSQEPRPIAAKGVPRIVPGEGLFIDDLQWTPEGRASALGGHHGDLSPTVKTNTAGEVVFLHSAALCRHGAIPDLLLFDAALDAAQLQTFSALTTSTARPISSMNYKELLCLILGLDHLTASDTQIADASKGFAQKLATALGQAGKLETLTADLTTLRQNFDGLQGRLNKAERDAMTREALSLGKLVPLGAEIDKLSNEQFKAVLDGLQAGVVPVEKRTPDQVKTYSVALPGAADSTAEAIRKAAGISEEDWKKHAK